MVTDWYPDDSSQRCSSQCMTKLCNNDKRNIYSKLKSCSTQYYHSDTGLLLLSLYTQLLFYFLMQKDGSSIIPAGSGEGSEPDRAYLSYWYFEIHRERFRIVVLSMQIWYVGKIVSYRSASKTWHAGSYRQNIERTVP